MSTPARSPGRTGYVVAIVIFLLAVAISAALVVVFALGLIRLGDGMHRVVAPGSEQVELADTGSYTIFYEYESRVDGVEYSTGSSTPSLNISVIRVSDGAEIPVRSNVMSTSYSTTNRAGHAIRSFDIDQAGEYTIAAEYADGRESPEIVLAIGQGVVRQIITSVGAFFGSGIIFCSLTLIAGAFALITFLRRRSASQAQAGTSGA